jgi:hypothetical protein
MGLCEEILPMGKYEWERVTERYNRMYPRRQRKMVNLHYQLNTLSKQKPPTDLETQTVRLWLGENDPEKLTKCDILTVNGSTKDVQAIALTLSTDPKKVVASRT